MADWNQQNFRYTQDFQPQVSSLFDQRSPDHERNYSYDRRPNDRSYNREPTNERDRYYGREPSGGSSFYNREPNTNRNISYGRESNTYRDVSSYNNEPSEERHYYRDRESSTYRDSFPHPEPLQDEEYSSTNRGLEQYNREDEPQFHNRRSSPNIRYTEDRRAFSQEDIQEPFQGYSGIEQSNPNKRPISNLFDVPSDVNNKRRFEPGNGQREFNMYPDNSSFSDRFRQNDETVGNVLFNQNSYGHSRNQDFALDQYGFQSKNEEPYGIGGRSHTNEGNNQFHRDDIKSRNPRRGRGKFRGGKQSGKRNEHSQSTQGNKQRNTSGDVKQESAQYVNEEPLNKSMEDNESECEDDEGSNPDKQDFLEKINQFIPDESLKKKYKFYPPTAEEMGRIFEGLVIFFFHKVKNIPERNPFVVICESFRRSDRFAPLKVEDGYQNDKKMRKFCTLRWNDMMMARGVSEVGNLKEPRVRAGVELINKLAMTCYSLKMKGDYFSTESFETMLEIQTIPGVFRVVTNEEAPNFDAACNFITKFFEDDTDCELVFTDHLIPLKVFARAKGFDCRATRSTFVAVFIKRTPQYWRDKLLASGRMENEKFLLTPPQGLGNNLLGDFDIASVVQKLRSFPPLPDANISIYGPKGVGPSIVTALPPWERGGPRRRNRGKKRKGGKFRARQKK